MTTKLFFFITVTLFYQVAISQEQKMKIDEQNKLGSAKKSAEFSLVRFGESNMVSADLRWLPILANKCISREPKIPNHELIEKMKAEKLLTKQNTLASKPSDVNTDSDSDNSERVINPIVGANWLGNTNNGSSPLDNNIAISNGGIIVSVANTTIEVDDIAGNLLYYNDLPTFFNDAAITNTCDPVVLYDRIADRFILFFQECAGNSANSFLCICFSKTNNPATGGWWTYKITGNPLNDNSWFDYPKMAISNNELYITGNLFNNSSNFNQAVLYQIQKAPGYAGGTINWQYWSSITGTPFTLLPVSNGHGLSYGPGCFLVATEPGGGNTIKLYDLTDDMSAANEQLNYYSVSTVAYAPAANSYQSGTACLLDNGDCRTLSGFFLNGIVHFAFHCDIGSGWNGVNYNRLNPANLTNQTTRFGFIGNYDYSYPSIASYATSATDKSVMIGFGRTGSTIFPQVRVVGCDDGMNWPTVSTLVKNSASYVSYTSTTTERWGDYTGITRKHNSSSPSVWMNGMFGNSANKWDTWIAEIHGANSTVISENKENESSLKIFPNPIVEGFSIEFQLAETNNIEIKIMDIAGKTVKELYNGRGIKGDNVFTFNKANLSKGTYFLMINDNKKTIKNEKIIIAD